MKKATSNHKISPTLPVLPGSNNAYSVDGLITLIEQKSDIIEKKSFVIDQQQKRIALLEEYLRLERARRFAPSSEKHAGQGELFNEMEQLANPALDTPEAEEPWEGITKGKKKTGRKGLSKSLPRHQIHLDLSEDEKAGAIDTFYTVVKEELDIVPPIVRVLEYLQEKAVFPQTDGKRAIKAAPQPKHPLGKCIASLSLLAYVIVGKYCDGLPLYRLEGILKRYGGEITRTSLANWVIQLSLQLQPLINLMREHQLSYDYLQIDETRLKVLKEVKSTASTQRWMWVSRGGPPDKPVILFDYDPTRSKEVPLRLLEGFRGYLQCDGLESYEAACQLQQLIRLGCFDHARRKFMEAKKAENGVQKKTQKLSKADIALSKIGALYRLEREIKDCPSHEKYQQRQKVAIPLLDNLKYWLDSNVAKVPKDSLTSKAIRYSLNQWDRLVAYTLDGRLHISNVLAENAIRPFVIGRKGWLFADTPKGAQASATHYSLIESCKANGLEPYKYYRFVLGKLPYAKTVEDIEALLPWKVKATFEKNSAIG